MMAAPTTAADESQYIYHCLFSTLSRQPTASGLNYIKKVMIFLKTAQRYAFYTFAQNSSKRKDGDIARKKPSTRPPQYAFCSN